MELVDEHRDLEAVRDQARMSALFLYRMLCKGYSSIMAAVLDEEAAARRQRTSATAPVILMSSSMSLPQFHGSGVFYRDMAVVGSLGGFNRAIPVK